MASRNVDLIIRARDDASKAFEAVNKALNELAGIQTTVSAGSDKMSRSLDSARADSGNLAKSIATDTAGAATKAASAFERVGQAVDKARARFEQQKSALSETEARYRALTAQTTAAGRAVENMRGRVGPFNDDFQTRLTAAQKQYKALTAEVTRLGPAVSKQQVALEEAAQNLDRVESAAGAAALGMKAVEQAQRKIALGDGAAAQRELAENYRRVGNAARVSVGDQERVAQSFRKSAAEARALGTPLQQAVRMLTQVGPAADRAAVGLVRGSNGFLGMRRAMAAFYGDSRRALSLMQRIRGEVLSLTASFVGFYGIFNTGKGFLEAFQTMEAAQNRFGAAFQQNTRMVGAELAFVSKEAERLGFSFGVLTDDYSKFLISALQAGLEVNETRKIFTQVTEAARVLKLSNEQINGVLVAMSQIAGKGTVQMEELRQQLGDRLPGAVGIMAQAMGYGKDELSDFYKAVEQGNVGARDGLVALGQGLEDAFGGQLEDALDQVTAKIGRFQDLVFQRQLTATEGGFIDGLETALEALNAWLDSDAGIQFFTDLGAAMGSVFELLPGLLDNMDKIGFALKALVALKTAQVIRAWVAGFAGFNAAAKAAYLVQLRLNSALMLAVPATTAAIMGSTRLGVALNGLTAVAARVAVGFRALWASVGGPIGAVITAISFFAVDAILGANDSVSTLDDTLARHRTMMAEVQAAYLSAAGSAREWKDSLEDVTKVEVEAQIARLKQEIEAYRASIENTLSTVRGSAPEKRTILEIFGQNNQVSDEIEWLLALDDAFNAGEVSGAKYKAELERLWEVLDRKLPDGAEEARTYILGVLEAFLDVADGAKDLETALDESEAALRLLNGTATEADEVLLGLKDATDEAADGADNAKTAFAAWDKAIRDLANHVPELKAQLDKFDSIAKIEADFQSALAAARALPDAIMRIAAAQEALQTKDLALGEAYAGDVGGYGGTDATDVAAQLLRDREGFRATPYWDVNAYRVGYGSDTITLADGSIQQVVEGMRVSVADANRDLVRRIETEFMPTAARQSGAAWDGFNAQQKAALTSIAYNYGSLPERILDAVRTGTDQEIAAAIQGLAGDNDGINRDRRYTEAALFTSGVGEDAAIADQEATAERLADEAERRAEAQRDFTESLGEGLEQQQFELSIADQAIQDREVAKALREAELEAAEVGLELTQAQREEIERVTRAKFAGQAADEARNASLERANALEAEVNLLLERRRFLEEQAAYYREQGDEGGLLSTETELEAVNAKLDEAIQKSIQFWQALGGPESAAAIQRLQQTQSELQRTGNTATFTGEQIANVFTGAVVSAIDRFARRVAEGEDALTAFKEEFMRMAAEILIQLATMILRQAIFNALTAGSGGGIAGGIAGAMNSIFHGGGIAGGAAQQRTVDPVYMANAVRYHSGGMAGLRPDEVPAILQKGEEVLTEGDPRHRYNGGLGGGAPQIKVINAVDGSDALDHALSDSRGSEILVNWMRANADTMKAVME